MLTNELPIYGDRRSRGVGTAEPEQVRSWAQTLVDAVRAGGGRQPVSVGDGAWGVEVTGTDNGFRVWETAELVDFLGPHVYASYFVGEHDSRRGPWWPDLDATFGVRRGVGSRGWATRACWWGRCRADGTVLTWFVSQSPEPLAVEPDTGRTRSWTPPGRP